jgi:hypothetical protein
VRQREDPEEKEREAGVRSFESLIETQVSGKALFLII